MNAVNDPDDSNYRYNTVIIKDFRTYSEIHEHDFISVKSKREQISIICRICSSIYCEKCGKLVMTYDNSYMQHDNTYN
jgi:formylmethanofuran dehydrogenase subunit E